MRQEFGFGEIGACSGRVSKCAPGNGGILSSTSFTSFTSSNSSSLSAFLIDTLAIRITHKPFDCIARVRSNRHSPGTLKLQQICESRTKLRSHFDGSSSCSAGLKPSTGSRLPLAALPDKELGTQKPRKRGAAKTTKTRPAPDAALKSCATFGKGSAKATNAKRLEAEGEAAEAAVHFFEFGGGEGQCAVPAALQRGFEARATGGQEHRAIHTDAIRGVAFFRGDAHQVPGAELRQVRQRVPQHEMVSADRGKRALQVQDAFHSAHINDRRAESIGGKKFGELAGTLFICAVRDADEKMAAGIANVAAIERARGFDLMKHGEERRERFADGGNFTATAFGAGPRENRRARRYNRGVLDEGRVRMLQIGVEREHAQAATLERGTVCCVLLQSFCKRRLAEIPARQPVFKIPSRQADDRVAKYGLAQVLTPNRGAGTLSCDRFAPGRTARGGIRAIASSAWVMTNRGSFG